MINITKKSILSIMVLTLFCVQRAQAVSYEITDGIGKNLNGEIVDFSVLHQNENYYLFTQNNKNIIQVLDLKNGTPLPISNVDQNFTEIKFAPYVTVYDNMNTIIDKFYDTFGRMGISNTEMRYVNIIFSDDVDKAIWTGENIGINSAYANSLDILAHEYTHSIIQEEIGTIKLTGETGALEESLADIFASIVDGNFTIGEGLGNDKILRSLSNPSKYNQPMHMNDYVYTEDDYDGVHINNGIPNYAFYRTYMEIGSEKTAQIYYNTFINKFNSDSQFTDFKNGLIEVANDLYSKDEAEKIESIWSSLGVQ